LCSQIVNKSNNIYALYSIELVASLGDAEAAPLAQGVGQPRETREGAIRKNALNPVLDRGTDMGVVAAFVVRVLLVPSPCVLRLLRQALSSVFSNHSNLLERFTKLATSSTKIRHYDKK
jgi:hypothetical protein